MPTNIAVFTYTILGRRERRCRRRYAIATAISSAISERGGKSRECWTEKRKKGKEEEDDDDEGPGHEATHPHDNCWNTPAFLHVLCMRVVLEGGSFSLGLFRVQWVLCTHYCPLRPVKIPSAILLLSLLLSTYVDFF